MNSKTRSKCALLTATALGFGLGTPSYAAAPANSVAAAQTTDDIIVTARRVEERLQDVPISITVINQQQIDNNNISNPKDLAAITPGLQINSRYGSDATNFSIRGFTQEQRTQATVGVYFADVVAPRGSGGTFGGDGAGPGSLFDLHDVQVLKGPQGTLQGRNSTGGAVLLVPKRPSDRLEGYVEGSYGDYGMWRTQGVLNVPLSDTFKVRLGVDHETRDGYLKNIGNLGDGVHPGKGMGDVEYTAERLSILGDLTPNLENYIVVTHADSSSNGAIPKLISCDGSVSSQNFGVLTQSRCQAQMAREAAYGPWTVENRLPDSHSIVHQWQATDTLTWRASDSLTIKNITSYAEYRQSMNLDLFGNYYLASGAVNPASVTSGAQVTGFAFTHGNPFNGHTNAQSTFVEELRFQGIAADGKFNWQGGLYAEISDPIGWSGVQTATGTACADIDALNCVAAPGFSLGSINYQTSSTKFRDYAIYGQGTYSLTEKLKFTAGLRYTWDKEVGDISMQSISGATPTLSACANATAPGYGPKFPASDRFNHHCVQELTQKSHAPTWTIGLDYKPVDNAMLYAKYSRGYRAGGLSLFGPDSAVDPITHIAGPNLQPYKQEKVDTYEVGAKTSWHGAMPGSFDVSGFYNHFTNQQLLLGAVIANRPNAMVANAGKSRLYGLEAEFTLRPFDGMKLDISYAYLNTKIQAFTSPDVGAGVTLTSPLVGDPVYNTQPHKVNISGEYTLPFVPASLGKISLGATYVYTAGYKAVAAGCPAANSANGCYDNSNNVIRVIGQPDVVIRDNAGNPLVNINPDGGKIPASNNVNVNVNWNNFVGMPVDLGFFVTNLTNEVTYVSLNDNTSRSFRSGLLGEPRMYGFRLKYRFGQ